MRLIAPKHPPRVARRNCELGGIAIPAGYVSVSVAAANRDPAQQEHPDRFDSTRTNIAHLTFGAGPHVAMSDSALPVMLLTASGQIVSRFAPAFGRASGGLRGLLFRLGRWAVRRTPRSPDRGASCCQVQPLSD